MAVVGRKRVDEQRPSKNTNPNVLISLFALQIDFFLPVHFFGCPCLLLIMCQYTLHSPNKQYSIP